MNVVDRIAEAAGVKPKDCETCVFFAERDEGDVWFRGCEGGPCGYRAIEDNYPAWHPDLPTLEAALAVLCPEKKEDA
jgi:hypothetical protein